MPHIPDGELQVSPYPFSLTSQTGCRAISDDDLCAWCSHLLYRPGELSLCNFSLPEGHWPSRCDEDGYAQSCPSLLLNLHPQPNK
ncbi:hypothetical protein [Raoultella ornithinolytica]|uniref:hypothetical protein n=1 Tax=Raoultella ornithinolytica TaxID=54291 RepID=UPI002D7E63AA|nr:hypothetical protein [Raoultella ornithinolytica]MEB4602840.1 hypothetical protein [Raoultella ornithinolytica]